MTLSLFKEPKSAARPVPSRVDNNQRVGCGWGVLFGVGGLGGVFWGCLGGVCALSQQAKYAVSKEKLFQERTPKGGAVHCCRKGDCASRRVTCIASTQKFAPDVELKEKSRKNRRPRCSKRENKPICTERIRV